MFGRGRPKKIANVETPKEEVKPKPMPVNTPQEIKKAIEVPEVMEEEEEEVVEEKKIIGNVVGIEVIGKDKFGNTMYKYTLITTGKIGEINEVFEW